jgi:hypothetical protein
MKTKMSEECARYVFSTGVMNNIRQTGYKYIWDRKD